MIVKGYRIEDLTNRKTMPRLNPQDNAREELSRLESEEANGDFGTAKIAILSDKASGLSDAGTPKKPKIGHEYEV
jgi:hypothetical protein